MLLEGTTSSSLLEIRKLSVLAGSALCTLSATTVLAGNVSKPAMDVQVVAATMDRVPSTSSAATYIIMALLAIAAMNTVK